MVWLAYDVKRWWHVQPFRQNTGLWRTDGQTDRHLATK